MNKIIKQYTQPAFLICLCFLFLMGWLITAVQSEKGLKIPFKKGRIKFNFVKEPIPPNKSLSLLDEAKLKPFEVIEKHRIKDKDILDSLGTEEYIQWTLRKVDDDSKGPAKNIMAFITYYEKPDAVPHVPEECYTGGGYQSSKPKTVVFNVKDIRNPGQIRKIHGRIVTFTRSGVGFGDSSFPVLYFFNVNGKYVNHRDKARFELRKNIFLKHSYFSKVEIVFNKTKTPNTEEAVRLSEEILAVMLPLLEQEHWPTKQQLKGTK